MNYVQAGMISNATAGVGSGLWGLEISDHALDRCIERSGLAPDAIVAEAHHNLLRLRAATVVPDNTANFLVKAGPGGFVCRLESGRDVSGHYIVYARAATWMAGDMLHGDQVLLADDGTPGERLGDALLAPFPLSRIVKEGAKLNVLRWQLGLPELPAKLHEEGLRK